MFRIHILTIIVAVAANHFGDGATDLVDLDQCSSYYKINTYGNPSPF